MTSASSAAVLMLAALLGAAQPKASQSDGPAMTLGQVAMLVQRSDPEYRVLLRSAIGDANAGVRTVAARVAALRRQGDMRGPLADAMSRETDETAKKEQARALNVLTGPADALLLDHSATAGVRTVPVLVPGLLASLVTELKCKPGAYSFGVAHVYFDGTGVGARAEAYSRALTGGCVEVLKVMAMLATPDESASTISAAGEYLLLPLDPQFIACSSLVRAPGDRPPGTVTPPKRTREVRPDPVATRDQIVVVVVTEISDTGCIHSARVDQPNELQADLSALRAVTAWRFEPARVGSTPLWTSMVSRVVFRTP